MGNNASASSRTATPGSTSPAIGQHHASASLSSSLSTPGSASASASAPGSTSSSLPNSDSPRQTRREPRNIIPPHTTQRSVVPPEASFTQAHGSTVVNRPKSLPPTAISSLSGSPHTASSTPSKSAAETRPIREEPEPSKPVDVPIESSSSRSHHGTYGSRTESQLVHNSSISDMYLRGPPRLPLPIEEEVHTPGSPILGPDDGTLQDIEPGDDGFTRKSSGLSATTADDEDNQELRVDKKSSLVATKIEWKRGGDKVYVTGTIFHWNRKHRLQPVEGKPGCFAAEIHILPGTHHLRFLVDGVMTTSHDLPTTVDFGNNLVNYIEVSPDDVQRKRQIQAAAAKTESEGLSSQSKEQLAKAPKGRAVGPIDHYKSQIPQYLIDFDQAEDSPAYNKAVAAIEKLPTPPTLPGFLAKPILNAAVLMKDDNSVLNMPNHTVLNHLATSSIKNNVLAVSATTRYRNKYVTTIMYKPSTAD